MTLNKVVALLSVLALGVVFASATEEVAHGAAAAATEANSAAAAEAGVDADADTGADTEVAITVDTESEAETEVGGKRTRPINCMDAKVRRVQNRDGNTGSGVFRIKPLDGGKAFDIFCDMTTAGGGWNVFSRLSMAQSISIARG